MSPHGIEGTRTEVHQNPLRSAASLIVPNFIPLGKRCTRKALQFFYTIQYFGTPGGPPGPKFTNLCVDVQQGPG